MIKEFGREFTFTLYSSYQLFAGGEIKMHTSKLNEDDNRPGSLEAAAAAALTDKRMYSNFICFFCSMVTQDDYLC